jgi:hypothetical protein
MLYEEGEKTKTDAAASAAYKNLLSGFTGASRHGSVALASEALDSYVRVGGSKELAENLRPSLTNIVHIDDSKNFESYMSKVMMSLLKGDIQGKLNPDTREYEPPNIQQVRQGAVLLWNTFNPDKVASTTQGAVAPNEVHENMATMLTQNLSRIADPEAQVQEAIKIRDKLNRLDSSYIEGMKNTNAINALSDTLKATLFPEPINVFEPAAVDTAMVPPTPEGQPIQDDKSLGFRLGAGAAEMAKEAVTTSPEFGATQQVGVSGAVSRGADLALKGASAVTDFTADIFRGATGLDLKQKLLTDDQKTKKFWGEVVDKLKISDVSPYSLGWPHLPIRLRLEELGYTKDDMQSLSPSELAAIIENSTPKSQAR